MYVGVPDPPEDISVEFDGSSEMLNITVSWEPPTNLEQFDLDYYTVNVTSISRQDMSIQVSAGRLSSQFTDERMQRATFNVTITATNRCGQTSAGVSESLEYVPMASIPTASTTMASKCTQT